MTYLLNSAFNYIANTHLYLLALQPIKGEYVSAWINQDFKGDLFYMKRQSFSAGNDWNSYNMKNSSNWNVPAFYGFNYMDGTSNNKVEYQYIEPNDAVHLIKNRTVKEYIDSVANDFDLFTLAMNGEQQVTLGVINNTFYGNDDYEIIDDIVLYNRDVDDEGRILKSGYYPYTSAYFGGFRREVAEWADPYVYGEYDTQVNLFNSVSGFLNPNILSTGVWNQDNSYCYLAQSTLQGAYIPMILEIRTNGYKSYQLIKVVDKAKLNALLSTLPFPFTRDINLAINGNIEDEDFPDYVPPGQGDNTEGGGNGDGDNSNDQTPTGGVPGIGVADTFNAMYTITKQRANELASYLWTSTFIDDLKLFFNNPAEGIVSLRLFPFDIVTHDSEKVEPSTIVVGNVNTQISSQQILSGYNCRFDFGSLIINEYWGSFLDYAGYTQISIWLPYVGFRELDVNEVMGKTLNVFYIVDIATGVCNANIEANGRIVATYDGNIGVDIPVNATNMSQLASKIATASLTALSIGIGAGFTAKAVGGTALTVGQRAGIGALAGGGALAGQVPGFQTQITKGGTADPFVSFYQPQQCYLIIKRPIQSLPSAYGALKGYPSNVSGSISTFGGFLQVSDVKLDSIACTQEEKSLIENLLKGGVFVE